MHHKIRQRLGNNVSTGHLVETALHTQSISRDVVQRSIPAGERIGREAQAGIVEIDKYGLRMPGLRRGQRQEEDEESSRPEPP